MVRPVSFRMTENRRSMLVLVVLCGVIISICMGLRQSLGLYQRPMMLEAGVSAAAFGLSIALQNIVWGVTQPFIGAWADRSGARLVAIVCALIYAAGVVLMIYSGRLPGALEVSGFLIGVGTAGTGLGVLVGTVARATPPEKRIQTVGLVSAAGSIGTFIIAPLGQSMIGAFGWQGALAGYAVLAASMLLLALPIRETVFKDSSSVKRQDLGEAVREATGHRGFVFMTLAFFACGFQLIFLTTHLPAYLQLCGVAPGVSATAIALIGLFNAIGTYIFGLLGARYNQRRLLALIYLLRTTFIAVFLLVPVSAASTLIFASAMGFLWLGVTPLITGIIGRVFGLAHFNTLYGMAFLSHQVGSFFGAWMGGVVFDRAGNYDFAWGALLVIGAAAFTLQWLMNEQPPRARAPALPAAPA
jgi:predicted MFS family arabinose efflux permease